MKIQSTLIITGLAALTLSACNTHTYAALPTTTTSPMPTTSTTYVVPTTTSTTVYIAPTTTHAPTTVAPKPTPKPTTTTTTVKRTTSTTTPYTRTQGGYICWTEQNDAMPTGTEGLCDFTTEHVSKPNFLHYGLEPNQYVDNAANITGTDLRNTSDETWQDGPFA